MSAYEIVAGLGATMQFVGFSIVAVQVSRILSAEYGEDGLIRKAIGSLSAFGRQPHAVYIELHPATARTDASLTLRAEPGPQPEPSTDAERLEQSVRKLQLEFESYRANTGMRLDALASQLEATQNRAATIADELEKSENAAAAKHRSSLHRERAGAVVFLIGTALTLIGVLI